MKSPLVFVLVCVTLVAPAAALGQARTSAEGQSDQSTRMAGTPTAAGQAPSGQVLPETRQAPVAKKGESAAGAATVPRDCARRPARSHSRWRAIGRTVGGVLKAPVVLATMFVVAVTGNWPVATFGDW